jgi:hypothetical protein
VHRATPVATQGIEDGHGIAMPMSDRGLGWLVACTAYFYRSDYTGNLSLFIGKDSGQRTISTGSENEACVRTQCRYYYSAPICTQQRTELACTASSQ